MRRSWTQTHLFSRIISWACHKGNRSNLKSWRGDFLKLYFYNWIPFWIIEMNGKSHFPALFVKGKVPRVKRGRREAVCLSIIWHPIFLFICNDIIQYKNKEYRTMNRNMWGHREKENYNKKSIWPTKSHETLALTNTARESVLYER